ncbi:amino acid permease [Legionella taurinensis]|uniref:Amino acid permease n=2 Tax=Legionella taurinensis TaxID=70611 RepID=A0A3A5LEV1_9GAMM|nr:amino acid permease [Legionella taurinensis]PUT45517.1 amino acid permease [Legionella taurinensis]PUT46908.1 amino acid permease [Legionella taurinensis]PUT49284.1 amino acid permease [Legionella taurinensis]RJT49350.1 amino acid permease [Legionella taurinensis]
MKMSQSKAKLSLFKLVMMTVVAIDSLKNLPTNAQYGSELIMFYLLATLTFFIPSALVTAELATAWPATGGIYVWVREAFGKGAAFLIVWMQWLMAMSWYPAILSFISATLAYLISAELAVNSVYIFFSIQLLHWGAILVVSKGLTVSSRLSTLSAVIGVIIPMLFFIALAIGWVASGHSSEIDGLSFSGGSLALSDKLRLYITLLYSLMGMEIIAAHAGDVRDPQTNFPRALLISAGIILATVIPASLAIAMVVPAKKISLISGVIDAYTAFLKAFDLTWLKPIVILAVALGSFGIFFTWFLASSRCLLLAAQDGSLPTFLQKTNREHMPIRLLVLQGVLFSVLSFAFVFLPSVNSAFWLFSAAAAQCALLYYVVIFMTALRLRYCHTQRPRPFRVGRKPWVMPLVIGVGSLSCLMAFAFGFIPPSEMDARQILQYELWLVGLLVGGLAVGGLIYQWSQRRLSVPWRLAVQEPIRQAGAAVENPS